MRDKVLWNVSKMLDRRLKNVSELSFHGPGRQNLPGNLMHWDLDRTGRFAFPPKVKGPLHTKKNAHIILLVSRVHLKKHIHPEEQTMTKDVRTEQPLPLYSLSNPVSFLILSVPNCLQACSGGN